jgi:hypothetical protein
MRVLYFLLFSMLAVPLSIGQTIAGIAGTVEDQTGSLIPGAHVLVQAGAYKAEALTDSEGSFRIENAPVGAAKVTVRKEGFTEAAKSLEVESGRILSAAFVLTPSALVQQVEVAAIAQLLQTDRTAQTSVLTTKQMESLPTASRNYTHLVVGEAGVAAPLPDRTGRGLNLPTAPGSETDDATQSLNPSVNGARPTSNSLMINGVDATNMMNGAGSLGSNINVPLDALEGSGGDADGALLGGNRAQRRREHPDAHSLRDE